MATAPLDGMRVLDFTTTIAGPYCTRLMADLGAEVIKIETAEGDMMRTRPPLRDGASTSYGQLNRPRHRRPRNRGSHPPARRRTRLRIANERDTVHQLPEPSLHSAPEPPADREVELE